MPAEIGHNIYGEFVVGEVVTDATTAVCGPIPKNEDTHASSKSGRWIVTTGVVALITTFGLGAWALRTRSLEGPVTGTNSSDTVTDSMKPKPVVPPKNPKITINPPVRSTPSVIVSRTPTSSPIPKFSVSELNKLMGVYASRVEKICNQNQSDQQEISCTKNGVTAKVKHNGEFAFAVHKDKNIAQNISVRNPEGDQYKFDSTGMLTITDITGERVTKVHTLLSPRKQAKKMLLPLESILISFKEKESHQIIPSESSPTSTPVPTQIETTSSDQQGQSMHTEDFHDKPDTMSSDTTQGTSTDGYQNDKMEKRLNDDERDSSH